MFTKVCTNCKETKKLTAFGTDMSKHDNLKVHCKECRKIWRVEYTIKSRQKSQEYSKVWRENNKKHVREYYLSKNYNITNEDYDKLLMDQNYSCAICLRPAIEFKKALFVDHNHKTGKIRGLLCSDCNVALGLLKEDTNIIQNCISYVNKWN